MNKRKKTFLIVIILLFVAITSILILYTASRIDNKTLSAKEKLYNSSLTVGEYNYNVSTYSGNAIFLTNQQGMQGNDAFKIIANSSDDAMFVLHIMNLEPNEFYQISSYAKVEGIKMDGNSGVNIGENKKWATSKHITSNTDWTKLETSIRSNASGCIDLNLRIGFYYSLTKGTVWFDNIEIEKITDSSATKKIIRSSEGRVRILLDKSQYINSKITDANAINWANKLSNAKSKYEELVGYSVYNNKLDIVATNYFPPKSGWWAIEGDPIQWENERQESELRRIQDIGDWSFGILHEIGHSHDSERWNFDAEMWANTKMVYILEELNGTVMQDKIYSGKDIKNYYMQYYNNNGLTGNDGITYKLIDIKDTITNKTDVNGWEVFKNVFRYFNSLKSDQVPNTNIGKLKLFLEKLSDYSGINVLEEFNKEEWKQMVELYNGKVATNIELNKTQLNMIIGDTENITVKKVTPTDAIYTNLIWNSENTEIAKVNQNGTIEAVGKGTTKINVRTIDNACNTSINVVVENINSYDLKVKNKPTKLTYYVGDTLDTNGLVLEGTNNNGKTFEITERYTCSPTELTQAGTQTITVTYGEKTALFDVSVKEKNIETNDIITSDDTTNTTTNDTTNNTTNTTINDTTNTTANNYNNANISPNKIPQTGTTDVFTAIAIIALGLITGISIINIRRYKDIK